MIETLINEEIMRTFLDDQGNPVRAIITGRLVFRFTNVQTGESVVENISGPVHITYHEDGSETWILGGRSSFPLFPGEPGGPAALLTSGRAILEYGPGGELVAVDVSGGVEDLCQTLA